MERRFNGILEVYTVGEDVEIKTVWKCAFNECTVKEAYKYAFGLVRSYVVPINIRLEFGDELDRIHIIFSKSMGLTFEMVNMCRFTIDDYRFLTISYKNKKRRYLDD